MKKIIFFFATFCIFATAAHAQFTTYGKIEYERKSNMIQQMEDMRDEDDDNTWYNAMKSSMPKFFINYFNYEFTTDYALYKPGKEVDNKYKGWGAPPAGDNVVFTDFKNQKITANKQVYEEKFLLKDTLRKLQWKIMDEIRTIANYKCRKAVTRLYDSVVVVAFYTDDIMVSGGPEQFGGLPGMILEIAIPRLHTTWIATNIEISNPKPEDLKAPEKGKKVDNAELYATLNKSVSKWGKWGQRSIWWSLL